MSKETAQAPSSVLTSVPSCPASVKLHVAPRVAARCGGGAGALIRKQLRSLENTTLTYDESYTWSGSADADGPLGTSR